MNLEDKLKPVKEKIQQAIELELSTIPPYLVAGYSIMPGTNAAASRAIRSVAMEEMLHMLLAGNLLTAVGGNVRLGAANIPVYPLKLEFQGKAFKNREFDIHLAALTEDTLDVFLKIELPDFPEHLKAEWVAIPGYTIGEFYNGIKQDLLALCEEFGESMVFSGKPENQLSQEYFWRGGGSPIVIRTLQDAFDAIDLIVEQGEGAMFTDAEGHFFEEGKDIPHYFRFNEVYKGRYYKADDSPLEDPTGDVLEVDYNSVFPVKANCKTIDYEMFPELKHLNEVFNANYSMMLSQLEEGFNGNPQAFYTAILNGMRNMSPIAESMMRKNIPGTSFNACPTFEWIIKS